jgi:DNA (cytosine-5)-methyltransferase 1
MTKPRALDLFCGAGGVAKGLQRAGFHVTGVDIADQPRYCGDRFIRADVFAAPIDLRDFDFVWASPPCQAHTSLRKMWNAKEHADFIPQTRAMLVAAGVPYAMENVPGSPLRSTIMLCGSMFDLVTPCGAKLRRHRYFETSFLLLAPPCHHRAGHRRDRCRTITVTGHTPQQNVIRNRVRRTFPVDDARAAMDIDWMTMTELSQAIPPAYAEFIGKAAMRHVLADAA